MVTLFAATAIVIAARAAALAFALARTARIVADFMTHDAGIYWWVVRRVSGRVFLTRARVSGLSGLSRLSGFSRLSSFSTLGARR
jgi:hypothetical protein